MPISTTAESKMPVSRFTVLRASLATETISFLQVSEKRDLVSLSAQGGNLETRSKSMLFGYAAAPRLLAVNFRYMRNHRCQQYIVLILACGSIADQELMSGPLETAAGSGAGVFWVSCSNLLLSFGDMILMSRHCSHRVAAPAANALAAFELLILTRQVATSGCKVTSQ